MFSYEDRMKVVNLLIQYNMSYANVVRELGYPTKMALRKWYYEYKEQGDLHSTFERKNGSIQKKKSR